MLDHFTPLSFIAGPAILTSACAILQNGASIRYNLAITQWRDFRASLAAGDDRVAQQYRDTQAALALAEQRIRLLLLGLGHLNAAVALFAATATLGLGGAYLVQWRILPAETVGFVIVSAGSAALLFLLASTLAFFREGACGRALLTLHRDLREPDGAGQHRGNDSNHAI
ncbi:hypothetical protein ACUSIJ_26930 [Pseudochelatococcus sp. B33]